MSSCGQVLGAHVRTLAGESPPGGGTPGTTRTPLAQAPDGAAQAPDGAAHDGAGATQRQPFGISGVAGGSGASSPRASSHARPGFGPVTGTSFAVWAPNARGVRVVADFNHWDGRGHPMRSLGSSGVWELFVPGAEAGMRYKFEICGRDGTWRVKADPMAQATEHPPATASVIYVSDYTWGRPAPGWPRGPGATQHREPMSAYEVHLGSWRPGLSYRQLADELTEYVTSMGFTHVEFLPVAEHPFGGSWGYQVSSYYAPTARFGSPDDFRYLVDRLHQAGIGVIIDWVPAHFPRDDWALARFDGTPLYEDPDPRRGEHPDWGTLRLQLRPPRGAELPGRQRAVLARGIPHRRPAGGRGRLHAVPGLLTEARANGPRTSTAGGRTWRPSRSCRKSTPRPTARPRASP